MRNETYRHTQPGIVMRMIFGISVFTCLVFAAAYGGKDPKALWALLAVAGTSAFAGLLFHSLTVCVSREAIRLHFGIGLIRKSFAVDDIRSVQAVRSHWYNGWGIRLIRNGWLYNISGFDAVEIVMRNGKVYRIGTDEPRRLLGAIQRVTGVEPV